MCQIQCHVVGGQGFCGQTRKEKNSFRSQPEEETGISGRAKGSILQAGPRRSHKMCHTNVWHFLMFKDDFSCGVDFHKKWRMAK